MIVTYFTQIEHSFRHYTMWRDIDRSLLQWHKNPLVIIPHGKLAYQLAGDKILLNQEYQLRIIEPGEYVYVPAGKFAYLIHDSTYEPENKGRLVTLMSKIV